MTRFLIRRVLLGILILFLVSVVVFAATQTLPGNAAQAALGRQATPARLKALTDQLHLNQSAFAQYWHWLEEHRSPATSGFQRPPQEPVTR